ncbi:MAG: hypothetical protein AB201_01645 [Parcubacteria bacterium C7867-006]|nr:MAG: hypothetical protein AB201_01645 [Parcubacteria bacterium C7867-006]
MFSFLIDFFANSNFLLTFKLLYYSAYVLVPFALVYIAWEVWVAYVRALFFAKTSMIVLEIKLPKDIFKSPKAMEFCIQSLHQLAGEKNWFEKFWQGKVRAWTSLEIASIDGGVHFFIWIRKSMKNVLEANLYSQYPGIEIYEVPDYTLPTSYNPEVNSIWASEFDLTGADVFPIKTYIDYGMDKDPDEEYKIDPMTPLIEFLGSLGRGQQAWIQILIRAHVAEEKDPSKTWSNAKIWTTLRPKDIWDRWAKKDFRWKEAAQVEIDKIITKAKGEKGPDGKIIPGTGRQLTDVEKETVTALARSVSKKGFDVGMRAIYIAPKDIWSPDNIGGIIGGITHFNSHLNGFKPARGIDERFSNIFIAWKTRSLKKRESEKQYLLDAYKHRGYFYGPFKSPHFVLNTEELATLFHLPGGVSTTPTFTRIDSKKSQAPTNLPV